MQEPQTLMTVPEVCKRIGCSSVSIWNWEKRGNFPSSIKPGGPRGKKYYNRQEIEDFMAGKWRPNPSHE